MPAASVIIATRDRAGRLRDCLACLRAQSAAGAFDVIVVDNGSTDDTRSVIDDAARAGLGVRGLFVPDPNRGKARNAGIAAATGDRIIFCDDDTLPPRGYVDAHLRAGAERPDAVVSGPIVNVASPADLPPPGARHFSRAFLCTCNASVDRGRLVAAGGFDERYDLYGWEDTDLGVRLRAAGARRVWSWDAYIYHVKPPRAVSLEQRLALAAEKGAMAARFVRKSPSLDVRLATGAYGVNFVRARVLDALGVRRWSSRAAVEGTGWTARAAAEMLVDAAYIDALRAGLRRDAV